MLKIVTKVLLILALCGAMFATGYYVKSSKVVIQTEIKEVEKVVIRKVTVREQAPDGTVSETTTEESTSDSNKQRPDPIAFKPLHREWALGIQFDPSKFYQDKPSFYPTAFTVEKRVLGNAWAGVGYNWLRKEISLELRYEF